MKTPPVPQRINCSAEGVSQGASLSLLVSVLGNVTVWCRRAAGFEFIQLGLQKGLQTSTVLALVGTQFRNAVFKSSLLGLDGSHDLVVLLGCLCLECSSLVLGLTDLSLSAGVRFRLSLLCLSLSIRNQLLRTSLCLRQLGGRTRLSFSQLLFSSFACLSQHGIRFRACLVGETVRHVLSHAQDAGCLHVGLWGRCTSGASSRTCCSAGCGGSCWCSSGGGLRRLERGVFLLRSFQFLLSCFQLLTNLSGLILSCLNLSSVISSGRCCCWLRRLSFSASALALD